MDTTKTAPEETEIPKKGYLKFGKITILELIVYEGETLAELRPLICEHPYVKL